MPQDKEEGLKILRHAAKYLQARFKESDDDGDFKAMCLLKWLFTADVVEEEEKNEELAIEAAF